MPVTTAGPGVLQGLLTANGFEIEEWRDMIETSRSWFLAALQKRTEGPRPNLGLHLLIGDTGPEKFQNVGRNLVENRISVFQGVLVETSTN